MRKTLGAVVLGVGVAGLSLWGARHHAHNMEQKIAAAASETARGAIHSLQTSVTGRDITARGLANSEAERVALLAALDAVEGRRVVRDEITVLERASPYTLSARRAQGVTTLDGYVPHDDLRPVWSQLGARGTDALTLAAGAPDGWPEAVSAGIRALHPLDSGQMRMRDTVLALAGTAPGPDERQAALSALSALPEGVETEIDISMRDDGTPPAFDLMWHASDGARVDGKLPRGMDPATVAEALGLGDVAGAPETALLDHGHGPSVEAILRELADWLPQLERARLAYTDAAAALTVTPTPGSDQELITAALSQGLNGVELMVIEAKTPPAQGSLRRNAATGQPERFIDGFWLPELAFEPSARNCASQSDAVLAQSRITFVTGSARLGPRAVTAINKVAAVMRPCVTEVGLIAELGGHTDDTGDAAANDSLSLSRAQAVKSALVSRGVPAGAMTAVGYGQSTPIADNSTESGRAANRRTTIRWFTGE